MVRWKRTLWGLSALLGVLPVAATAGDAAPSPPLWKIENGDASVFLFGSFHTLPAGMAWRTPEISSAVRAADVFVFEVPLGEKSDGVVQRVIREKGVLPARRSLAAMLTPEERGVYLKLLDEAGLRQEVLDRLRPWLATLVLGLAYTHPDGFASLSDVDAELMKEAEAAGKDVRFLETMQSQLALITSVSRAYELRAFRAMLAGVRDWPAFKQQLLDAWAAGDVDRVDGLIQSRFADDRAARKKFLDDRNAAWMDDLEALLTTGQAQTAFVTVGAAHFGGEAGLLAQLCARGWSVQRVGQQGAVSIPACPARRAA